MSETNSLPARANALRLETIRILENLLEKANQFGLPLPLRELEPLDTYRQLLINNTYKLLVVGEAKRGKSTFVNALMGRDLLPTDSDIATSQVFYVRRAQQEAYRLRFEDDSEQPITSDDPEQPVTAKDLARYGSQVVADSEGGDEVPPLNKIIRWIEVEGPFTFIPQEVHVLDTPGLGSLYRDHAIITRRCVRLADAVIFVLDSTQLAGEPDIDVLNEILAVTSNIFFIQTKIDKLTVDKWQEILQRHRALLQERFSNRLADLQVWPIASPLLRKSARANDPYDVGSHHRELAKALQHFLARVSGWARTADALVVAKNYHDRVHQVILKDHAARLKSSDERQEMRKQEKELRREFEASWGVDGTKRRKLLADSNRCFDLAKREFEQAIRPRGSIELLLRKRIDEIKSVKEAKQMANDLASEVVLESIKQWEKVCKEAARQGADLLKPFRSEVTTFTLLHQVDKPVLGGDDERIVQITASDSWWAKLKNVRGDMMLVSMVGGAAVSLIFPPAAIFVMPAAIVGAVISGWGKAGATEVERGKQQLRQHLSEMMDVMRQRFLNSNFLANQYGLVDEYFAGRKRALAELVDQIARQKLMELKTSIDKLGSIDDLSDEQRKQELLKVQKQLSDWVAIGVSIKEAIVELDALEQSVFQ